MVKKFINVYQCELGKEIPLEYIGKVKYMGPYDPLSFVNGNEYNIVYDNDKNIKVVDETEEDYLYNLREPNSIGGRFYFTDDPNGILRNYLEEFKSSPHTRG